MKTIDKISYKFIILIIVMLNIFIGSNIKQPIWLIQAMVSTFSVIYILIKKIQKEAVIINGKIDRAVLIFMISTVLPVIFRKYSNIRWNNKFYIKILVYLWVLYNS